MELDAIEMNGAYVRLEPIGESHKEELRRTLDCDPDNWAIQMRSAQGEHFDSYWAALTGAPARTPFAVRDLSSGRLAGTSGYINADRHHHTVEIGGTWFRPEFRGSKVNPETKLLMLGHAFGAGAERVQFTVDSRNARSRAAMAKLGAVEEGIIRRQFITWTGHRRDSVLFSIIADEWPEIREGLQLRVGKPIDAVPAGERSSFVSRAENVFVRD